MTNLEIREFSETLKNYINTNTLPLEVKRMVLADITKDISEQTAQQLMAELKEREQAEPEAEVEVENDAESV